MALYFQNAYSSTVWFSFLYYDTSCAGTPFRKLGWYRLDPGQTLNLWDTDLRYVGPAAFYAEEWRDSGGATWSGTGNNWYPIRDVGFDQCFDDDTGCNQQPDFIPLDFNGFVDVTVTLGPIAGQLDVHGTLPPLPGQLDFDWFPITLDNGCPVGGSSHLTIHEDGTYQFSGHLHDSGALEYNTQLMWLVMDSHDQGYSFRHSGHVSGTFESGSRDDIWEVDGQNDDIAQNWASIVARNQATAACAANSDFTNLFNSIIGIVGTVLGVIGIVVA
jgi:hypothetical protein